MAATCERVRRAARRALESVARLVHPASGRRGARLLLAGRSLRKFAPVKTSHESLWLKTAPRPSIPPLQGDLTVDVCIVGGGITGITAAALLQQAGKTVALLDAGKLGNGVTGFTTAHLTEALDTRWYELIKTFGKEGARLAAQSQRAAIERIASLVEEESLDCGFRSVPGYFYCERDAGSGSNAAGDAEVAREFEAARAVGLQVSLADRAPLPFATGRAVRFENQARFHPLRYCLSLAQKLLSRGAFIHEDTRAVEIRDGEPCTVHTAHGTVTAAHVLVCTHSPVNDRFFLQTKLAQYRSYVVAARLTQPDPQLDALFWDNQDPYHYLRMEDGLLLAGGEDHKVGQKADTREPYERLRAWVRARFGAVTFEDEWSGQVVETLDGLPYVGRNATERNVFVATGFAGNGMTHGTMAALLLRDLALGRVNPWASVYAATRISTSGALEWARENVDFPLHLIGDKLKPAQLHALSELARGEGRLVEVDGEKLAAYRADDGKLTLLQPACTHLGCTVGWNPAEKSWDCPCHGGRFNAEGEVINGPPLTPLKRR